MSFIVASILLASGQAASPVPPERACASIYFVGFERSVASVVSGDTRWRGLLSDYDPSTDLSAEFRLCPVSHSVRVVTVVGEVTVPIPASLGEVHILVDSRDVAASKAEPRPPLLD
jgi:hypothetical protein